MSENRIPIRRALVSVYDKTGLEELVRGLHDAGVTLVSTGGSAKLIEGLGLPQGPGKAVQDEAPGVVRFVDPVHYHLNRHIVGDEITPVHVGLG